MSIDIKNFYLETPMTRYEYLRIPVESIPVEFMLEYNLFDKVHNNHVYLEDPIRQSSRDFDLEDISPIILIGDAIPDFS